MVKNELIKEDDILIPNDLDIKTMIYEIRGQRVMLDSDLARLYGYEVKRLNEMVKNNIDRFPSDFMWKLTKEEYAELSRSKISTLKTSALKEDKNYALKNKTGRGNNIKYYPYVFTEQGIYALSGILKGPLATSVSINLIRAFKQLKDFYSNNSYLLDKVINTETKLIEFKDETNDKFNKIFDYMKVHEEIRNKLFYKVKYMMHSHFYVI